MPSVAPATAPCTPLQHEVKPESWQACCAPEPQVLTNFKFGLNFVQQYLLVSQQGLCYLFSMLPLEGDKVRNIPTQHMVALICGKKNDAFTSCYSSQRSWSRNVVPVVYLNYITPHSWQYTCLQQEWMLLHRCCIKTSFLHLCFTLLLLYELMDWKKCQKLDFFREHDFFFILLIYIKVQYNKATHQINSLSFTLF